VVFPVAKTFTSHDVKFVHGEATTIDPTAQQVQTTQGMLGFDYLVIATGYLNDFEVVPGLGPGGHAYSITSLEGAVDAAEGWARLLNDPGPVVVAATQGAACFGAAYEFVFNVTYQLRKQKLKVPVAYVSAEPFPGHFGIGGLPGGETLLGMFFRRQKIDPIFDVAMEEVAPGELRLADGRKLPFKYGMVVPPFLGAEVVTASGLATPRGSSRSRTPTRRWPIPTSTRWGSRRRSTPPGPPPMPWGCPRPAFPPRPWLMWPPRTSPPRSAARNRPGRRTSVTSRRCASWMPATTGW
jgi:sulfide:quinone oxidoreductase